MPLGCGRSRFVWSVGGSLPPCFGSSLNSGGDDCGGLAQATSHHRGGAAAAARFSDVFASGVKLYLDLPKSRIHYLSLQLVVNFYPSHKKTE